MPERMAYVELICMSSPLPSLTSKDTGNWVSLSKILFHFSNEMVSVVGFVMLNVTMNGFPGLVIDPLS